MNKKKSPVNSEKIKWFIKCVCRQNKNQLLHLRLANLLHP